MHTKPSFIENGMLLFIEWILFFTLTLFWSHWGGSILHMVWTLLGLGVLLTAGVLTLQLKFNQNRMVVYYALCLVVVFITWRLFSWPIFLSFVFTLYFLWRLFSFVEDRTINIRWWLWIATICLTLILWLAFQSSSFHKALIAILIIQTILVIGFEVLQVWRNWRFFNRPRRICRNDGNWIHDQSIVPICKMGVESYSIYCIIWD